MPLILGIDYGRKRVGVAISDDEGIIAFPADTLEVESLIHAVRQVAAYARRRAAEQIVVGMPLNMNGTHGEMAQEVAKFSEALGTALGQEIITWDERMTTISADQVLLEADVSRDKRKAVRDRLAAQQMLQSYLDAHAGQVPPD